MFSRRVSQALRVVAAIAAIGFSLAGAARGQTGGVIEIIDGATYSVVNGSGVFSVPVSRAGSSAGVVTAAYNTVDGTAVAGRDYVAVSGVLSWADGDASDKTVQITVINQPAFAGQRTFTLVLSQPTGGASIGDSQGVLTVQNSATVEPTILISSPPSDITVTSGDTVPFAASVTDPSGILAKVQFYLNGQLYGETKAAGPYALNAVAPAAGTYELEAIAIDKQGNQSAAKQTVTVLAADPANPPPTAAILTDVDGRALAGGAQVPLSVSAVAVDGLPLRRVDFYADGEIFDSFTPDASAKRGPILRERHPVLRDAGGAVPNGSVFSAKYNMPGVSKLVSLIAVALSQAGQSHISAPVTVQAVASSADHAPHVAVSGIKKGAQVAVGATVNVPVTASDPDAGVSTNGQRLPSTRVFAPSGVIARMEYYLNELKVKDSTAAPFGYEFSPPSAGTYVLSAIATDGSGLASVSKPVTVEAVSTEAVSVSTVGSGAPAEGAPGKVLFTRTGDLSQDLTVYYRVKTTAVEGVDYEAQNGQPLSGSIVISAGSSRKRLKLNLLTAGTVASRERIKIQLLPSPADAYQLGDSRSGKIYIDPAP